MKEASRDRADVLETAQDVMAALDQLILGGLSALPRPGAGATASRFRALSEIAARDLSLARLAEGHTDALAILDEAKLQARAGAYGVWAAEPPDARVAAERTPRGWVLRGTKRYASGARGLARALVTAEAPDGGRLFDVALRDPHVRPVPGTWHAVGMAATESLDVVFDGVAVAEDAAVGAPGFYLARAGFWRGAVGVAACWFGGALGAYRMLHARLASTTSAAASEHHLAHLGAVAAIVETMQHALDHAAAAIDAEAAHLAGAAERERSARRRALVVRQVVEQGCQEVLARVGRASGSSALVHDREHARRAADLIVYLRQHHAERDLVALGHAVLEDEPC